MHTDSAERVPFAFHDSVIKYQTTASDNTNDLLQITAISRKCHLKSEFKDGFLAGSESQYWPPITTAAPPRSNLLTPRPSRSNAPN